MKFLRRSRKAILPALPEHRSPGWRRRSAIGLLTVVLAGTCGYWYLTGQTRLAAMATTFLQDLSGGQVEIQQIDFSFFGGIHVTGLTVRTPAGCAFGPADNAGRIVFCAAEVQLRHQPLSLLIGRFDVERIVAIRPEFRFVTDKATGRSNWQMLLARPRPTKSGGKPMPLPPVQLKQCMLRSGLLDGTDLQLAEPLRMDLAAVPAAPPARAYDCLLQPLGPDRLVRRLRFDLEKGTLAGDLPGVQFAQFQRSLPAEYARWFDILELSGQIGADSIDYDPAQGARCAINLSRTTLSVPFGEDEFYGADVRARRMVHLAEVTGRIVFEPACVSVDISGLLDGQRVRVWGTMTGYNGPLQAMGYDLHIDLRRMAMPDSRDPYVVNQVRMLGPRVLKILRQFEPTAGWMSFQGHLSRPPGEQASAKFRGEMNIHEADGRFDDFPYHGSNTRSTIRFTDDGILFDVLAHRGRAAFQVSGWVADGSSHSDADVTVDAVSVPLDDELYETLPPKFKSLWRHFDFFGLISCKFHLRRIGGTPEDGAAPWQWSMHMTLHDVAARYEGFQVMQWGVNGTIDAADGLISRIDLRAINLDAVTRITGTADLRDGQTAVDLRVTTKNRPLTADLMPALPPQARDLVREANIRGLFDVDASVKLSDQTHGELLCQATVDWHEGSIYCRQWPYPLQDVHGRIWMDQATHRIEIRQLSGRNGPATLRLAGTLDMRDNLAGRFQVAADDLPLDDQLYQSLPASIQHWWQAFEPKGRVGVRSELDLTESAQGRSLTHRTSLLLAGNEICWDAFPLPLKDLNGKLLLSEGRCQVQDLTATHDSGQIRVDGAIAWDEAATRAQVQVSAKAMPMDESLRLAAPWQIRRLWNSWQPAGRMDLDLTSLRFVKPKDSGATWDLDGTLAGRFQKLDLAVNVEDAVVASSLAAHIDEDKGTFEGHGRLRVDRAVVSSIPVTDARADWARHADGTLRLQDLHGKALGGTLAGFCELEPTPHGERYGVVLSLDHGDPSQLAEILSHGQMSGVTGSIQMQMRMRGLTDQPETRSGAAEIQLTGQGLYRLPILLQLANVLNIPVVSEPRDTQQLSTKLTIIADQAILDSLELRDNAFLMLGNGQIDLPSRRASLTVIAAQPRTWPKIPVFTELLEGTLRELVEVHGSGPLNDLKFEARPLRSIQAALQTLSTGKHHVEKPKIPKIAQ